MKPYLVSGGIRVAALAGLFGISACDANKPTAVEPLVAQPAAAQEQPVAASQCGTAPQGDIQAERIVAANSTRDEAGLYEGPVWANGALYFSDFTFSAGFPSRIQKLDASGMSTFIDDSGSNGLSLAKDGSLLAATHKYKGVSRYQFSDKSRVTLADSYEGNPFNSPNDLIETAEGTVYFTDPSFQSAAAPGGQPLMGVYRIAVDGSVTLVDGSLNYPNGIVLSPAEDILYVNGGSGDKGVLRAYALVDGQPQAGRDVLTDLDTADGMTVDCHGNLYITEHTKQRLRVVSPSGEALAVIHTDANITNAVFGGDAGKTLYLTGAGAVWRVDLDVTGAR